MDKVGSDMICKNHSARSERDQFRICPTKLSKQELEDLYFALVEDNLKLKKTINGQQDRIKVLSTKLQRMTTTQKIFKPNGRRDCCVNTKVVVNQQKEMIADLKHVNERMADRIRKLNMTLCSAKQFSKSVTPKCLTCSSATSPYLIKSLHSQRQQSQSTLKLAVSCHNLSRNAIFNKYSQTESFESIKHDLMNVACEDNKCITVMDELKQKINNLQKELSDTKEEYSARITTLQEELEESRNENIRVRSERALLEQEMLQREKKTAMIVANLRGAEGLSNELKIQLSIEHRKVAELETRLKAATMSNRVTESIENTLSSIQESAKSKYLDVTISPSPRSILDTSVQTCTELSSKTVNVIDETRLSKNTDDSGYIGDKYTDKSIDDESLNKVIEELTKRILILQSQVDSLTISPPEPENVSYKIIANELTSTPNVKNNTISNNLDSIDTAKQIVQGKENSHYSNIEIKPTSTKKDESNLKVPIENISVSKNVITNKNGKKTNNSEQNDKERNEDLKNDSISNGKIDKRNENSNYMSKDCDIERDVENNNNSDKSDEKTYTVPNKEKNAYNSECKLKIYKTENVIASDFEKNLLTTKVPGENSLSKHKTKKIIKSRTISKPEANVNAETEPPRREATYTLNDNISTTSTDDTDYEISSMTDLSEDREPKRTEYLLSPGEQMYISTQSESVNITTDTKNYSLSEGEIPTVRRRSIENNSRVHNKSKQPAIDMEDTLHAISDEIARCKRLLFSQRSRDNGMSALM